MKKTKLLLSVRLFSAILMIVLFYTGCVAQIENPVLWELKSNKLKGNEVELILKASFDKQWHFYSTKQDPDGPLPAVFNFDKSVEYELVGGIIEPKPHKEYDEDLEVDVFYFSKRVIFKQKIKVLSEKDFSIKGIVEFQVCNDETCIPYESDLEIDVKGYVKSVGAVAVEPPIETEEVTDVAVEMPETVAEPQSGGEQSKEIETAESITEDTNATSEAEDDSMMGFFILALIAGFIGALTPCVYPMIPITVSFFLNSSGNKAQGRLKAVFYMLSIIFIYTILGVVISFLFGADAIKTFADNWLTNLFFFLLFVVFAASFFGMFEIVLPSWIANKSDTQADKGGYVGTFFMALTLVVVSVSCTAPFVGGLLVEASTGQFIKPIIGMLGFSITFALPFTIFAFFPSLLKNMPKSGGWMNSVKVVLGFLILAFGTKFLAVTNSALGWGLTREVFIAFWVVLLILLGFYLLGKIKFSHDSDVKSIGVPRLFLAIASFVIALYLVPGMLGAPVKLISAFLPSESSFNLPDLIRENKGVAQMESSNRLYSICSEPKYAEGHHFPHGLVGYFDYRQGVECAKKINKPILLDFTSKGCANCKVMEKNVWPDPAILKLLNEEFLIIKLYSDDKTELREEEWVTSTFDGKILKTVGKVNKDLEKTKFNRIAEPYYAILDNNERLLNEPVGKKSISEFKKFLEEGIKKFHESEKR